MQPSQMMRDDAQKITTTQELINDLNIQSMALKTIATIMEKGGGDMRYVDAVRKSADTMEQAMDRLAHINSVLHR